jgi:isocitrate dehydrogenase
MKIKAPKMVYIAGEEMTRVAMEMILENWIKPNIDISNWEFFDLSCRNRDKTQDQVLKDCISAGARVKAIFKEPTITPNAEQVKEMGLSKSWGSPNGAMRKGWNGYTISRDTIHIEGVKLGYDKPVLFDRHAVGGEYGAGAKIVGKGKLTTVFQPADGGAPITVDERELKDNINAAVTYHNPLDNVKQLANHFFSRSLSAGVKPYVATKKTVFKWQEDFWQIMKDVFNKDFKAKFIADGIFKADEELRHLLTDDAAMKLISWKQGGFSMVAHNYDGDWLTDELAQFHKSSALTGVAGDGDKIMEFEASHGTVSDHYKKHLNGEETSMNPLGLIFALKGAMDHSERLEFGAQSSEFSEGKIQKFTKVMYNSMCRLMATGKGTRDLCGPSGLTTEQFISAVAVEIKKGL